MQVCKDAHRVFYSPFGSRAEDFSFKEICITVSKLLIYKCYNDTV